MRRRIACDATAVKAEASKTRYAAIFKILDACGKAVHLSLVATKDGCLLLFVEANVDANAQVPFLLDGGIAFVVKLAIAMRRREKKNNMQAKDENKKWLAIGGGEKVRAVVK